MPKKSRFKLPPINLGKESLGERLARLRKERGYTQVELAEKIGIVQTIISDYEKDRFRPTAEMIIRLAQALEVSTDELLGLKQTKKQENRASLQILRRLNKIQSLPAAQRKVLLKTIDTFIKAAEK
jgi:transcriptional regulator with XRE-family HTH domain